MHHCPHWGSAGARHLGRPLHARAGAWAVKETMGTRWSSQISTYFFEACFLLGLVTAHHPFEEEGHHLQTTRTSFNIAAAAYIRINRDGQHGCFCALLGSRQALPHWMDLLAHTCTAHTHCIHFYTHTPKFAPTLGHHCSTYKHCLYPQQQTLRDPESQEEGRTNHSSLYQ